MSLRWRTPGATIKASDVQEDLPMVGSVTPLGPPILKWLGLVVVVVVVAVAGAVFVTEMLEGAAPLPPNSRPMIMVPMPRG